MISDGGYSQVRTRYSSAITVLIMEEEALSASTDLGITSHVGEIQSNTELDKNSKLPTIVKTKSVSSSTKAAQTTTPQKIYQVERYVKQLGAYKDKLVEIEKKLQEVKQQREKLSEADVLVLRSKTTVSAEKLQARYEILTKKPKKKFFHPKLEYIYAEVSLSPYMTDPNEAYPDTATKGLEKIHDLRFKNASVEELPFDKREMKKKFVNDVLNSNEFYFPSAVSLSPTNAGSKITTVSHSNFIIHLYIKVIALNDEETEIESFHCVSVSSDATRELPSREVGRSKETDQVETPSK